MRRNPRFVFASSSGGTQSLSLRAQAPETACSWFSLGIRQRGAGRQAGGRGYSGSESRRGGLALRLECDWRPWDAQTDKNVHPLLSLPETARRSMSVLVRV